MNIQNEINLFRLNTLSSYYRSYILLLNIQLAAAMTAQNYPLVAQLNIEINRTLYNQKSLDFMQKNIIFQANANLKMRLNKLDNQISKNKYIESAIWGNLINSNNRFKLKLNSLFAVQPDSIGGIGPNYELRSDYKRTQNLSLEMQIYIKNKFELASVINTQQSLNQSCSIALNKEGTHWILETNLGKY